MKTYKSDMAQSIWPLLLSVQPRSFHARRRLFQVFHFWADGGDEQSPGTAPQASVASQSSAQSISGSTGQRCTNRWPCGFVGWKPVLSPAGYQDYCQLLLYPPCAGVKKWVQSALGDCLCARGEAKRCRRIKMVKLSQHDTRV